ncbi:MAG: hypothetical protein SVX38_11835 [Chloroflexota bacterium]|nr:hypothetical protein [Chloroflexota bacterium]
MIVYVDIEHDRLRRNVAEWENLLARRLEVKYRLEEVSGHPCLLVRYHSVNPALLRTLDARAVVVSGNATEWEHYAEEDLAGLRSIFRAAAWATLCFCGGCQALAQTFGAELGPMGPLLPGDPEPPPELNVSPGMRQERGFMPVRFVESHPLFADLGPEAIVYQWHYWEAKAAPPGFRVLAESSFCHVQAIVHEDGPLFGTQFHPEQYDDEHQDGRRILQNFFRLAGL